MMAKPYTLSELETVAYTPNNVGVNVGISRIIPTEDHTFITASNTLAKKCIGIKTAINLDLLEKDQKFETILEHTSAITCVGANEEGWLICTASENEVVLSKWDSVLNLFASCTIAEGLGKIYSCAVKIKGNKIWTVLSQASELTLLESVSEDLFVNKTGKLNLINHEFLSTLEKLPQPCTWLKFVEFNGIKFIVGISSGNSVSAKIWEFKENKFLIKDHYLTSLNKVFSSADMKEDHESKKIYMIISAVDGASELILVNKNGFNIINKFKILDPEIEFAFDNPVQIEFRILCCKFFLNTIIEDRDDELGNGDIAPNFCEKQLPYPKLLIAVASTKSIFILNALNGEVELNSKFTDILKAEDSILLSKAKLGFSKDHELIVLLHPLFQNNIVAFRMKIFLDHASSKYGKSDNTGLRFQSTKPLNPKTVLRKKLKSPPKPKPVSGLARRKSNTNLLSVQTPKQLENPDQFNASHLLPDKSKWKRRENCVLPKTVDMEQPLLEEDGLPLGPSWSRTNVSCLSVPVNGSGDGEATKSEIKNTQTETNKSQTQSYPFQECLVSSRAVRIQPKGSYSKQDITFKESQCKILTTRLSDNASYLRMKFTSDGKFLAVGGNRSPVVLYKTVPNFDEIESYKHIQHVTSLDFSFSEKHLMIGTNEGHTEIRNWNTGKILLKFSFSSKFNEHIHAQFYFMDKFILQPEENCINLYSYRYAIHQVPKVPELYLKAGSFQLDTQSITALAAPNRYYSDIILCGCSNKTLQVFDANAEAVILTMQNVHSKPISCIRINEAPEGYYASTISDLFLTSAPSAVDPIKLWDLRTGKCVTKIADINPKLFVQTSRPSLSPCGRYIASGFEENMIGIYDIRKIDSRISSLKTPIKSSTLDFGFHPHHSMLWCACRNGNLLLYNP